MPRKKKDSYALAEDGSGRLTPVRGDGLGNLLPPVPGVQTTNRSEDAAARAFQALLERTDGWLRCIPAGEGKLSYFKWKFSSGPHTGKYVMYVAHFYDWVDGIQGIADKVDEVDRGVRKPAQDTFYDPR